MIPVPKLLMISKCDLRYNKSLDFHFMPVYYKVTMLSLLKLGMNYTSVILKTGRSDIAPQMLVTLKEKEK